MLLKKGIALLTVLLLLPVFSCLSGEKGNSGEYVRDADYVQIVLFHLAQRCESCNAVERETLLLLENEYGDEVAAGTLKFISLNIQSGEGKKAAELLQASGQSLFVIRGDSITDLSGAAFIFASTRPDIYLEDMRKALDKALE